jgi:hypothetical protein
LKGAVEYLQLIDPRAAGAAVPQRHLLALHVIRHSLIFSNLRLI